VHGRLDDIGGQFGELLAQVVHNARHRLGFTVGPAERYPVAGRVRRTIADGLAGCTVRVLRPSASSG